MCCLLSIKCRTCDSPLLAAFRKRVKRYLHVECAAAEDSIPLYCPGNGGMALEVEYPRATVPCRLLCYSQPSVLEAQILFTHQKEWMALNASLPCGLYDSL